MRLWLGLAALLAATPAVAQDDSTEGEADRMEAAAPTSPEAIQRMHDYARCVAERRTDQARRLLAMDYRTEEYRAALRRITYRPGCPADRTMRANGRFVAARMAETLLRERLRGSDLAALVAHRPERPSIQARDEGELMSLCVVRAAPAEAAALFATVPATPEEGAAIAALAPKVAACVPAGATGRFNRPGLRSMLGLAAWRLAEHETPVD